MTDNDRAERAEPSARWEVLYSPDDLRRLYWRMGHEAFWAVPGMRNPMVEVAVGPAPSSSTGEPT